MSNYKTMAKRQRRWMLIIIGLIMVLTLFMPNKHFPQGILLGSAVSYYNLWILQRRANVFGKSAAKSGQRKGLRTASRFAAAALGAMIAIRYDLSVVGFMIGLIISYPVIVIDFILSNRK